MGICNSKANRLARSQFLVYGKYVRLWNMNVILLTKAILGKFVQKFYYKKV